MHARIAGLCRGRQRVGAVGEDVDLGTRIGADQHPGGAHRLRQAVGQVARVGRADGGQRPVVIARERRAHRGLHAGLDHHHLGRLAQASHELHGIGARHVEARGRHVAGLHRGRDVEHDDDLAGALAHHGDHRPRQRQRQRQQGQDLEDQQRVALQPLEERRGLAVADDGLPQQQARHPALAPADLEEVEQDQRQRQPEDREGKRREEAHPRIRPRSWATTKASTGVSVTTRW